MKKKSFYLFISEDEHSEIFSYGYLHKQEIVKGRIACLHEFCGLNTSICRINRVVVEGSYTPATMLVCRVREQVWVLQLQYSVNKKKSEVN